MVLIDKAQVLANEKVIKGCNGMLASVNGMERALTLGTGHCAAFCKAANAGCKTPISHLSNTDGFIDLAALKRQKEFKEMLEVGWNFIYLPWQVEVAWPTAPDIIQKALNASNEVHASCSELEGAVTIAEHLESGASLADAVAAANASNPVWSSYADELATLAQYYGGGKHVPLLHKLDTFAKQHGENRRLGQEFISAVLAIKHPVKQTPLPRTVDMLLACNLVSPKIVDGIAKCLTKTDVSSMMAKGKLEQLEESEGNMVTLNMVCEHLVKILPDTEVDNLECLFKVRYAAFVCNRCKHTFEQIEFKDVAEIIRRFLEAAHQLFKAHSVEVSLPALPASWMNAIANATTLEGPQAHGQAPMLLSTEEVSSTSEHAARRGFAINKFVFEKAVGYKNGLYKIISMNDTEAILEEYKPFGIAALTVKMAPEILVNKWQMHKGDVPEAVDGDWSDRVSWDSLAVEAEKCKLMLAMQSYANTHSIGPDDVMLCIKPNGLRAAKDFARHELVIALCVGYAWITSTKGAFETGHSIKGDDNETVAFYINKPVQPNEARVDDWDENAKVTPFCWVTSTATKEDANVDLKFTKVDGVSIPIMQNTRNIKRFDLIQFFKAASTRSPLEGVTVERNAVDGKGKAEAKAKAPKAKTTGKRQKVR